MSRPTKLTPDVQQSLTILIENGINERGACAQSRVGYSTYKKWLIRGRAALQAQEITGRDVPEADDLYVAFFEEIQRAREGLQVRLEDRLRRAIPDMKPRDVIEALARIDNDRWAKHDKLTVHQEIDVTVEFSKQVSQLLQGILGDLGLTAEQEARAPEVVARHLQLVSDTGDTSEGAA